MPGHYDTIKAQLTLDVAAVLGEGAKVVYGRLLVPKKDEAVASIFTSVSRQNAGRQVQETYGFVIGLMVLLPATTDLVTDVEGLLMGYANALIMHLAPYDLDDVPTSAGSYAGVASLRRCSSVKPLEREEADKHVGVVVEFSCVATVYQ